MGGLTFSFLASGCASFANYFFRKSSSSSEVSNVNFYLFIYFLFSFIFAISIYHEILIQTPNFYMISTGMLVGALTITLMLVTAKALEYGSAGLTFSFQNASAIFPGVLLFLFLGEEFGYTVTLFQILGLSAVLFGLYWGCRHEDSKNFSFKWLSYAIACFVIQVAALSLIQARCYLYECGKFPVTLQDDIWFMPAQFATATILQGLICLRERKKIGKAEALYGIFGGIGNGSATLLLLFATKVAMPHEKTMLFPLFAVSTIVLCNTWATKFYKEKFNFGTNLICSGGILISLL